MPLLVNTMKLDAAAGSLHQFCPIVRSIFPEPPGDAIVEAATVFLYLQVARDVFGNRFVKRLQPKLQERLKFADPVELELRVSRIDTQRRAFDRALRDVEPVAQGDSEFARRVRNVIRALLAEAGFAFDDLALVKQLFPRFEGAVRRLKEHLQGIESQSNFIMKRS